MEQQKQEIGYVIKVAPMTDVSFQNYGYVYPLQVTTHVSLVFAKPILKAIAEGIEDTLLQRDV